MDAAGQLAVATRVTSREQVAWLHDLRADRQVAKLPPPRGVTETGFFEGCCGIAGGRLHWMVHDSPRASMEHWTTWLMTAELTDGLPRVVSEDETWHTGFAHYDLSGDGRWIIGAGFNVTAYLYETARFYPRHELDLGDQVIHSVGISSEEDLVAVGLFGAVQLWTLSERRDLGRLKIPEGELTCLRFGAGKLVAVSEDEVPYVVQIDRERPPARWAQRPLERFKASGKPHRREVDLSPDGRLLAARRKSKQVVVIDLESSAAQRLKWHRSRVELVRFVAGGRQLLTSDADGGVRFWPRDGQRIVDQG